MSVGDKRRWREGRQMFKLHCLVNIDNSLAYSGLETMASEITSRQMTITEH